MKYTDKNELKNIIKSNIKPNTNNETSSQKIQDQLKNIVDSMALQDSYDEFSSQVNTYVSDLREDAFYIPADYDMLLLVDRPENNIIISHTHDLFNLFTHLGTRKNIIFRGGKLINGTIYGNDCTIIADRVAIFDENSLLECTVINDIYPEWFYKKSTNNDWKIPLQQAIDLASKTWNKGRIVLANYLYSYYGQLTIYSGVTIEGVGRGETAFGSGPTGGSVLHCLGNKTDSLINDNIALKVVGKMVNLKNFTLKGRRSITRLGSGLVFYGVGDGASSDALLEGCLVENVLIHGFEGSNAKGLWLVAGNSGSITYSNFNNIRIRDCSYHLLIECLSADPIYNNIGSNGLPYSNINCFINSNNFNGLYSSGYCIGGLIVKTEKDLLQTNSQDVYRPANNLIFNGCRAR